MKLVIGWWPMDEEEFVVLVLNLFVKFFCCCNLLSQSFWNLRCNTAICCLAKHQISDCQHLLIHRESSQRFYICETKNLLRIQRLVLVKQQKKFNWTNSETKKKFNRIEKLEWICRLIFCTFVFMWISFITTHRKEQRNFEFFFPPQRRLVIESDQTK